jgi:DNA-binding NtrC family response regulator
MRERPADIPALVQHFIEKVCREEGIPTKQTTDGVLERIAQQDWPGNVRQIENAVEMAIALSGERKLLLVSDFPLPPARPRLVCSGSPFFAVPDHGLDYERTVGSFELSILEQALRKTGGNKKLAADMLQLKRTTLAAKLKTLSEAGVAAIVQ